MEEEASWGICHHDGANRPDERELASLQSQVKSVEDSYGIDNLHLTLAKGYVAKLLGNVRVARWLAKNREEYLTEFQAIVEIESLGGAPAAAE